MACQERANLDGAQFWFGQSMYFAWAWARLRWVKKERKPWGQILLLCPAETGSHRETSCYMCSPSFFMCSSSFFFAFIITILVCNPIKLIWMTHNRPRMLLMLKQDEEVGEGFHHEFLDQISGLEFVSLNAIMFQKRFPPRFCFFGPTTLQCWSTL